MTKTFLAAAVALSTLAVSTSASAADWHRSRRDTYVAPPVYAPQPTYQQSDWRQRTSKPADDYRPAPRPRPAYGY